MYSCSTISNSPLDIGFFRFCLSVLAGGGELSVLAGGGETLPPGKRFLDRSAFSKSSQKFLSSKCRPVPGLCLCKLSKLSFLNHAFLLGGCSRQSCVKLSRPLLILILSYLFQLSLFCRTAAIQAAIFNVFLYCSGPLFLSVGKNFLCRLFNPFPFSRTQSGKSGTVPSLQFG